GSARLAKRSQRREKFLPGGRVHGLRRRAPESVNDHRRARHVLRIGRLHHVHSVEPPHGHVTVLPLHARALALDLRGNTLGDFPEILRVRECWGGERAENKVGGHTALLFVVGHGATWREGGAARDGFG